MELVNVPVPEPSVVWLPLTTGLAEVFQQTPRAVTAAPPSDVTLPPEVAVDPAMPDTVVVVRIAPPGIKVLSLPFVVPSLLTATIL